MDLRKAVFKRMFKGKTKIPYKIKIKGDQYLIYLRLTWKWKFFEAFMGKMSKSTKKDIKAPERFTADSKSYGFILKELEPHLKQIIKNEQSNVKNLKFLSRKIANAEFIKVNENINFYIAVSGVCMYDT